VGLTKGAIRIGRHPAIRKQACRVMNRKPGKDDYTKLMEYRSVSPLSCMGKVVEKWSQGYCQKWPNEDGY